MDQHPIPRQITSFEFKLIGFMTLRQFIYLIVFIPLGIIVYFLFPIPLLNILLGIIVGSLGLFFAFFPIYDRSLDVWVKNLYRILTKPTQFVYSKHNKPIYYLDDLFFVSDPHHTASHIESQEKLAAYLKQKKAINMKAVVTNKQRLKIQSIIDEKAKSQLKQTPQQPASKQQATTPSAQTAVTNGKRSSFFTGLVKNHKLIPLPGILIYVRANNNQTLRLLKTNPHGVFATFNPLPQGEYFFELKDPNNNYFFDTMKISISSINQKPIEIYSKELL